MFSNISRFFVWIIMGMVLIGLVGFGSFNFGSSGNSIGRVGDTDIDASAYFRELNAELNAWQAETGQNLTMQQAQSIGLDQQVLSRVIAQAALDHETSRLGVSVGDRELADRVTEIVNVFTNGSIYTTKRRNAGVDLPSVINGGIGEFKGISGTVKVHREGTVNVYHFLPVCDQPEQS